MATRSPLSRRPLTVTLLPPSSGPTHSRHLKRIHLAAEILKAAKICAGDVLIINIFEELSAENLSLEENQNQTIKKEGKFAIGIAWPSFTLSGTGQSSCSIEARELKLRFEISSHCYFTSVASKFWVDSRSNSFCVDYSDCWD